MSALAPQHFVPRRTPPLGVGGVTLLMLVTLVLTTSPALGRAKGIGAIDQSRSLADPEQSVSSQRAEQRHGGRRELSNRQIRPSGAGFIVSLVRAIRSPLAAMVPDSPGARDSIQSASDRVGLMLLNLPPPRPLRS